MRRMSASDEHQCTFSQAFIQGSLTTYNIFSKSEEKMHVSADDEIDNRML